MRRRCYWMLLPLMMTLGCQQNPYEDRPQMEGPKPPPPKEAPKPKPPPKGAWGLKVEEEMNFVEGQKGLFTIRATVPTPGVAKISVSGLPAGAVFDSATNQLMWTPDFQAANDPSNPLGLTRMYPIEIELTSSVEPNSALVQKARLIVSDVPQPANIKSPLQMSAQEGQELVHVIDIEDNEFRQGPFDVAVSGLPENARVEWPDRKVGRLILRWKPGYSAVLGGGSKNYGGHVTIFNPRGRRLEFDVVWTINSTAMPPIIAGPSDVQQSGDISFSLLAEDVNGENVPQWSVLSPPTEGVFNMTTQTMGSDKRSVAFVTWRKIPGSRIGKTTTVSLQACVPFQVCSTTTVDILPGR